MSGKAKTAQKSTGKDKGPNDIGYKHPIVKVTLVLEFRLNAKGNLAPKYHFEREEQ
mgnify:CR=1